VTKPNSESSWATKQAGEQVKLSTLLKAIEPLSIFSLKAESPEQGTKSAAKLRFALRPMPYANLPDIDIGSIHYKAQEVETNGLFVAIEGRSADGHDFIGQALARGAAAIVVQKQPDRSIEVESGAMPTHGKPIIVHVRDTRTALADLAVCFFCRPSEYMTLIGITGTNGKTTVAYLIESILMAAGLKVGVIGTINYRYAGKTFPNPMTTPESLDLQRILKQMLQAGVTHVAMEASSHAMDLYRIRGCRFDMAVFTNLSQDHLDFHGDMQSYWSSKKRLFIEYLADGPKKNGAVAVINCDDAKGQELANILSIRVIKTGSAPDCVIKAETSQYGLMGTHGRASTPQGGFDFKTPLVGLHNVANILSSTGAAAALGIAPAIIKAGIEALAAIPGRLESIENSSGRFVYVDYAHTPDALKNAVSALKQIAPARIICVFGCGGDRDREKRPLMGEIVARLCDLSIVTSDNPRTEDPVAIIDQILPGIKAAGGIQYSEQDLKRGFDKKGYIIQPDRRRAIGLGIMASRPNDAVIIAGKGHETYQILGTTTIDFDDREEARKALAKLDAGCSMLDT
jgi:UDP-N-acetylmuramoyl-L-alanyl-D-glutamate--2,6-diaminopimelate ligase